LKSFLLALCLTSALEAQEQTSFYLTNGKDTIFAERMTRTATDLRGEFIDRNRGARMSYLAALGPDGSITTLTTRYLRNAADTVGEMAMFKVSGDNILATMGSSATAATIPAINGVQLVINPSVGFIEQLIVRAKMLKGVEKVTIPLFILGAPQPVPATLTFMGADSVVLDYASVSMRLVISPEGKLLSGKVANQPVLLLRGPATGRLMDERKDYSVPGSAPYTAEEVVVAGRAGTFTLPKARTGGRAAAIVTLADSGTADRDGGPAAQPGYRPFRELADTLGKRGIAVLRLDGRLNADEIRAAIAYLRSRDEIDPKRIGVVAHSNGTIAASIGATEWKIDGFSYEKPPSFAVRKDVLGAIADWLSEHFR
jgi:hypothetical protein